MTPAGVIGRSGVLTPETIVKCRIKTAGTNTDRRLYQYVYTHCDSELY